MTKQQIIKGFRMFGIYYREEESKKGSYYFYGTREDFPLHTVFSSWKDAEAYFRAMHYDAVFHGKI